MKDYLPEIKKTINCGPLNRRTTTLVQLKHKDEIDYTFEFSGLIVSGVDVD